VIRLDRWLLVDTTLVVVRQTGRHKGRLYESEQIAEWKQRTPFGL